MGTRGKAKAEGTKGTTMGVRPNVVEEGVGLQQIRSTSAANSQIRNEKPQVQNDIAVSYVKISGIKE